jgi:WD40 repeat protein
LATLYPNLRLWRISAGQKSAEATKTPEQPRAPTRTGSADEADEVRLALVWSQEVVPTDQWSPTLAWSPDGQWLAAKTKDYSNVRLCDLSGRRGLSFRGLGDVQSLSWSPDSRQLAMGLWDERVAVCDAQTGQAVWIGVHLPGGEVAVFNGAGQLLPGQENKMNLFDQHLAYVVEHPDGRMEVVKPSQFVARAAELASQVTPPEWAKPVPTLPDGSIDLLPLVEIKPDANPEIDWTRDGKTLVAPHKDARQHLPIPITLSGDYDFIVQAEAPERVEGLRLLLQADGHQVDSIVCLDGHVTGLELIDGQHAGENDTLLRESLLGQGKKFQLTCQVRRNQIRVLLDDRTIVEWEGDFNRLSVTNSWGSSVVDGIFGLLAHAPYRIHELKLIPRSDEAKQSVNTIGDRAVAEKLLQMGANLIIRQSGQEQGLPLPNGLLRVVEVHFNSPLSDVDMPAVGVLLATLDQLRTVLLHHCEVTDDGLKQLPPLHSLNRLSLSDTLVRNPIAALSIDPNRFGSLDLTDTLLDDQAFEEIGKWDRMNGELGLARTQLTDDRLRRLNVLPKLGALGISDNPLNLSEEVIRQLVRFESLQHLSASKIPATEERLMQLAEIKQLAGLDLSDTQTTDRVLEQLKTLPNLRGLTIKNTPATEAGMKAFQAARPNCQVKWSPAP